MKTSESGARPSPRWPEQRRTGRRRRGRRTTSRQLTGGGGGEEGDDATLPLVLHTRCAANGAWGGGHEDRRRRGEARRRARQRRRRARRLRSEGCAAGLQQQQQRGEQWSGAKGENQQQQTMSTAHSTQHLSLRWPARCGARLFGATCWSRSAENKQTKTAPRDPHGKTSQRRGKYTENEKNNGKQTRCVHSISTSNCSCFSWIGASEIQANWTFSMEEQIR